MKPGLLPIQHGHFPPQAAAALANLSAAYGVAAWHGEGANCYEGGLRGVTDTFTDVFYYAYALSAMARRGVGAFVRQTLVGGDYGLLQVGSLQSSPSYWLAVLWSRLVGTSTLELKVAPGEMPTYLHASLHCSRSGGVVAVVINFHVSRFVAVALSPHLTGAGGVARLHLLTGAPGGSEMRLNGALLRPAADGSPPPLEPTPVTGPVALPPASVALLAAPGLGSDCNREAAAPTARAARRS
jgi:heparanase 1